MSYLLGERALAGDTQVVDIGGELDMAAVPELKASVERALKQGYGTLVVDLSEATFIDSTAIGVLVAVHQRLGWREDRSRSSAPSRTCCASSRWSASTASCRSTPPGTPRSGRSRVQVT